MSIINTTFQNLLIIQLDNIMEARMVMMNCIRLDLQDFIFNIFVQIFIQISQQLINLFKFSFDFLIIDYFIMDY